MRQIGRLEGAAEDGDGVILGGYVVEGFGAAGNVNQSGISYRRQGCNVLFLHPWLQTVILYRYLILRRAR